MRRDKKEHVCETLEVSAGGVVIATDVRLEIGEPVVAYFDLLGGVAGRVVRKVAGGYVIAVDASPRRRAKLVAQVQDISARLNDPSQRLRRHRRVATNMCLEADVGDGPILVRCLNISVSGALIECMGDQLPEVDQAILVGGRHARVIRHELRGYAVAFDVPLASLGFAERLGDGPRA